MSPAPVSFREYYDLLSRAGLLAPDSAHLPEAADRPLTGLCYDSRAVREGDLFVCKGNAFKEEYLDQAIQNGAAAYVSERDFGRPVPCLKVSDVRFALGLLADRYFGHPSGRLMIAGVTGTKGKTTTCFFLKSILDCWREAQGLHDAGLLSGIVTDDGVECVPASLTTPESPDLQRHLRNAAEAGCGFLVLEVSSQALAHGRVAGVELASAAFLNIGEDHISPKEHPDLEDYFRTKLRIFDQARQAVVNLDEPRCAEVLRAAGRCEKTITYSMSEKTADLFGFDLIHNGASMEFSVNMAGRTERFVLPMAGDFNVSNALAALALAQTLGVPVEYMRQGLSRASVPGRMEVISENGKTVVIDYAHNGMSLAALLRSVRQGYPEQPVTVVFGCTGGKGLIRRQGMGEAAADYADRIILTEDDPGPEEVEAICAEVGRVIAAAGKDYAIIADREEAVRQALMDSPRPGVVVLAGRGRQEYRLRKNGPQTFPTDCDLARKYLA
ncbi:MAG: UDP-N-acetylmuramoyl-L-alanyl-D-glutamate--2,6-diaminopimelate ligase [Firmicutes bacterium]|nr:UDP-N-acetylmuramoyl-L-alanyl-D-glutamate--2,6-diaminopimelate ligase [Bacillota bacterium]